MINSITLQEELQYAEFREFMGEKVHVLLKDRDAKNGELLHDVKASYAWDNWSIIKNEKGETEYFLMHDPLFKSIIHTDLIEKASKLYPDSFGTDDPAKVLEALNRTIELTYDASTEEWNRQTSYVAITNIRKEKVLYLGLFREISKNKKSALEFKSGYLHFLKHFCGGNKQPISSISEPRIIPNNFIEHITRCLFEDLPTNVKNATDIPEDKIFEFEYLIESRRYTLIFYYSRIFDIYFVSTIKPHSKK